MSPPKVSIPDSAPGLFSLCWVGHQQGWVGWGGTEHSSGLWDQYEKEGYPGRPLLPQQLSTDLFSERCNQWNKQLPLLRIKANIFFASQATGVRSTCSKPGRKPSWALYGAATVGPQTHLAQPEHGHAAPQHQPRGCTQHSPGLLNWNLPQHWPGLPGGGPASRLPSAHTKPRGWAALCATGDLGYSGVHAPPSRESGAAVTERPGTR